MKTALVLSGGGAKGAFQVGALTRLFEKGVSFDVVSGVSVGSLNGALVAQGEFDRLRYIWQNVREEDIFLRYSYLRMLLRNTVEGKKSLYSAHPLYQFIQQEISLDKIIRPFYIGITSLVDGKYRSLNQSDFPNNEQFHNGIYASSLMPILWEPVDVVTRTERIEQAVDGGLRNVTPLSDILREGPDKIYIISCNRREPNVETPKNIIKVAVRTFMDIMLSEVITTDVDQLLLINSLVKQVSDRGFELINPKTHKPFKYFETVYIEPPSKLGSPIDFSKSNITTHFSTGYTSADQA